MTLKELLKNRQDELIRQWTDLVHGTYPFGTVGFLRTQQNRFVNPVGQRTKEAAAAFIGNLLAAEFNQDEVSGILEEFMRVRSVQSFAAEGAVLVIFAIKKILRDAAAPELAKDPARYFPELLRIESDIDALGLMAFGCYARNRDLVARMRIDEFKRNHSQIIRQAERALNRKFPQHRLSKETGPEDLA